MDARKIIHIDMDAFYASVEVLDNPDLRGKAIVVGGNPGNRGVVAAASYEARKYGVRSAMPGRKAKELCPHLIFLPPRFPRYKEISQQIHEVFHQFTDVIESLALDEAWLDVTENKSGELSATRVAEQIRTCIKQQIGLTCSAGVSYNKFLSKIATEVKKPDGLFVIPPEKAQAFILKLNVRKIPYVGKVTEKKLNKLGIHLGQDLYNKTEEFLSDHFGKFGHDLYNRVRGIDHRPVAPNRERKSLSVENTFKNDLTYGVELLEELNSLAEALIGRMKKSRFFGKTLTIKIKFKDFQQITRSITNEEGFFKEEALIERAQEKLLYVCQYEFPNKPIRLLGIGVSSFTKEEKKTSQLDFFDDIKSIEVE